jgi:hypothetical protein
MNVDFGESNNARLRTKKLFCGRTDKRRQEDFTSLTFCTPFVLNSSNQQTAQTTADNHWPLNDPSLLKRQPDNTET